MHPILQVDGRRVQSYLIGMLYATQEEVELLLDLGLVEIVWIDGEPILFPVQVG